MDLDLLLTPQYIHCHHKKVILCLHDKGSVDVILLLFTKKFKFPETGNCLKYLKCKSLKKETMIIFCIK